jgi:hypothetical protein
MKKLIVAVNALFLLAGMLVMSSFLTNPANAASPDLQNGTMMMSKSVKPQRHRRHRRHARHRKFTPPKYQRYHKHPKHHPKPRHNT